jgi:pSer/pThr/pTyr-binding forkhead associated (FHA) protein
MIIRYTTPDGEAKELELTKNSITIGRSPEVDISLADKMVSRIHCGISFWDDSYFVRDFKSRNGTFLNDRQVDVARLNPGDRIRVGDTIFLVEAHTRKGADTVIQEVRDEMEQGKGYHTILQEIIREERKT